jgi:hypothetical protein
MRSLSFISNSDAMKKVFLKFALVLLLLVAMNWLYEKLFFKKDLILYSDAVEMSWNRAADSSEIVYVGESSNITCAKYDKDKRKISDYLAEYYPSLKVGDITRAAAHAEVYYYLLKRIPEPSNIKTIVVTMNMRSFGAGWIYSKLETPLQKELVLLKDYPPLFNRFMLSFKGYDIKTGDERSLQIKNCWKSEKLEYPYKTENTNTAKWDRKIAFSGIKDKNGKKDQALTELACHYVKSYAFQIHEDNPRLKDFDNIVKLAQDRGWNLVFNLMPDNIDRADELVGRDLIFLMKYNRDYLLNRYGKIKNVLVVDNLNAVRSAQYVDQNWTTEHYDQDGRRLVARNVAIALKAIYPGAFVEKPMLFTNPCHFHNECEKPNAWFPTKNLTMEQKFMGNTSSKVCTESPYSITLQRKTNEIPNDKKMVRISMQVLAQDEGNKARVVLCTENQLGESKNKSFSITKFTDKIGVWDFVNLNVPLDSTFFESQKFKVFVHNPSDVPVFVDNIDILFE